MISEVIKVDNNYRFMTAEEVIELPELQWRVKNLFPARGVAMIFGASMAGKSFLALDLIGHISRGELWFGLRTKPCMCVYLALEGQAGIAGRWRAFQQMNGGAGSEAILFGVAPINLTNPDDLFRLTESLRGIGFSGGIVVVDTLSCAAPGLNENDAGAMSNVLSDARIMAAALDSLVILVHHIGKAVNGGPRGSSVLTANPDALLEVTFKNGIRQWGAYKVKDGRCDLAHSFNLGIIELGRDIDGEAITSCFIEPMLTKKQDVRLTRSQKIAFDALSKVQIEMSLPQEIIDLWRHDLPNRVASKRKWRQACIEAGISNGAHGSSKYQAFNRALVELEAWQLVRVCGDWCWTPQQDKSSLTEHDID